MAVNIKSKVTPAGKTKVISVEVAGRQGPVGPSGSSGSAAAEGQLHLSQMADVNSVNLEDGAMLMYSESQGKWVSKTDLESDTGNPLILSGGNF
jgi:hypothetical protein